MIEATVIAMVTSLPLTGITTLDPLAILPTPLCTRPLKIGPLQPELHCHPVRLDRRPPKTGAPALLGAEAGFPHSRIAQRKAQIEQCSWIVSVHGVNAPRS